MTRACRTLIVCPTPAPPRFADAAQAATRLRALTGGHQDAEIVIFGAGAQSWNSYNAVLRIGELGYSRLAWYRGELAAWTAARSRTQ